MSSIIERLAALAVGTVESVSPTRIEVLLDIDAPQATAFNTGSPNGFPRINGYVLVPNETGAVVGLVTWLGVERSAFPKRTGLKDFGLVDLPYPLRKISITPLGTLVVAGSADDGSPRYRLDRGVSVFPSVGDPVHLPTDEQLRSVVESHGKDRRLCIGTAPLAHSAKVSVDPNKLFGHHLAVLGNTGSGKSCTLAGLIRWSLDAVVQERLDNIKEGPPNARFIVLDPNGEYSRAFLDMESVRIFQVNPAGDKADHLCLPAWMWNGYEWAAFASAAPQVQRPLLIQALRELRAGGALEEPFKVQVLRIVNSYKHRLQGMLAAGLSEFSGTYRARMQCGELLRNIADDAESLKDRCDDELAELLGALSSVASTKADEKQWTSANSSTGYNDFTYVDLQDIVSATDAITENLAGVEAPVTPSEDIPIPFPIEELPTHLDRLAGDAGAGQMVAFLAMRIRTLLADPRLRAVIGPERKTSLVEWLTSILGENQASNGNIAILDLSLVPADIIHIVVAVTARIVFETAQRYAKKYNQVLPTVLALEEAHTFVQRSPNQQGNEAPTPAQVCRHTFERIAREGRKFGLGLMLSSQRPSELSQTVLSQCNTFLLHRLVNDHDQELVRKLVPDNLAGLLNELPSLPRRQAVLLGWATPVPVLVEIGELPEQHCPKSSDPDFWEVWTGASDRDVDWEEIRKDWMS